MFLMYPPPQVFPEDVLPTVATKVKAAATEAGFGPTGTLKTPQKEAHPIPEARQKDKEGSLAAALSTE
jgi:hypothetical protein